MKVAIVTGGTLGIGLAIVRAMRAAKIKVVVVARNEPTEECDLFLQADLARLHDRYGLVDKVVDKFKRIDILVNNSGDLLPGPADLYEYTDWVQTMELMLNAPFVLSQQAKKRMTGGGHIVNITSTAAFQASRNHVGYITAKHGLLGMTRALAVEWEPQIHVNAVAPGHTDTEMTNRHINAERRKLLESITPGRAFVKPKAVADAVMYLINSTSVYGQTIIVDNGWMVKNG